MNVKCLDLTPSLPLASRLTKERSAVAGVKQTRLLHQGAYSAAREKLEMNVKYLDLTPFTIPFTIFVGGGVGIGGDLSGVGQRRPEADPFAVPPSNQPVAHTEEKPKTPIKRHDNTEANPFTNIQP